jgi:transcriptional regulator with XRE-family HTH domain
MSDALQQALALAIHDLNAGQLQEPERYLNLVPASRREELANKLSAIIALRGPVEGADEPNEHLRAAAFSAIAAVRADAGQTGILPGALKQMRKARGIERDTVVDSLLQQCKLGEGARPGLRRYYHQLESGGRVGSRLTHRLLRAWAAVFKIDADDLIAGARPVSQAQPRLAAAMARRSSVESRSSQKSMSRQPVDDPELDAVRQLFTGGPDG